VPLDRTESLARTVNPLSTRAIAGHLVSLSAAFFRVWRLTRHIMLFDHQSSASLASCSKALTSYVFNPINHFRLASFHEPHCFRCGIKHLSHDAGTVFAFFFGVHCWNRTNYLKFRILLLYPNELNAKVNLPRRAVPVASQPFGLQNTTRLMSFGLRPNQPCFADPVIPSSLTLPSCLSLRGQTQ
jgi:hypothetical protein